MAREVKHDRVRLAPEEPSHMVVHEVGGHIPCVARQRDDLAVRLAVSMRFQSVSDGPGVGDATFEISPGSAIIIDANNQGFVGYIARHVRKFS